MVQRHISSVVQKMVQMFKKCICKQLALNDYEKLMGGCEKT